MDYNRQWNRNMPEQQAEDWRTLRDQKMASRPQHHSDRPRTNSSVEQYGYGNQRQPMQPSHRPHSNGPRYNHSDQRWNANYNYSGYREHHSPHKQYQSDHRTDHRGHGSYHHNGQKRINFSSPKSQYNERKPNIKPHRVYSSCSSNNTNSSKSENHQGVSSLSEQQYSEPVDQFSIAVPVPEVDRVASKSNIDVVRDLTPSTVENDLEEEDTILDNKVTVEVVNAGTHQSSQSENDMLVVSVETESVNNILEESAGTEMIKDCTPHSSGKVANSEDEADTSENSVVESNVDNNRKSVQGIDELIDEKPTIDAETVVNELVESQVELDKHFCHEIPEDEFQSVDVMESGPEVLITESIKTSEEEKLATSIDENCINSETVLKLENHIVESVVDTESNTGTDIELRLSYELDEEDLPNVSSADKSEATVASFVPHSHTSEQLQEEPECDNETSGNEKDDVQVSLPLNSVKDTDAPTVVENEEAIAKEIKNVESKLASISIAPKNDASSDNECTTPMKRERKKALIDATNILPSSTIKFAVREIRKNDESEIVVTPVRRSLRLSSVTPIARRNVVQNLEELTPEIKQKMKFKQNPAINNPDC